MGAFESTNLISIDLPKAKIFGNHAFWCNSLVSVSMGTGFKEETEIYFGSAVFASTNTMEIELTLDPFVLTEPDLIENVWNFNKDQNDNPVTPCTWKIIKVMGIEEVINNFLVDIYPNLATDFTTIRFELEKSCNVRIVMCDILGKEISEVYNGFAEEGLFTKTINANNLISGTYFLKISIDKNYIMKKVNVN